ncbi:MAG: hypothetical protein AMS22_06615, partial [Thiotrichales bacterium SG8_50]
MYKGGKYLVKFIANLFKVTILDQTGCCPFMSASPEVFGDPGNINIGAVGAGNQLHTATGSYQHNEGIWVEQITQLMGD